MANAMFLSSLTPALIMRRRSACNITPKRVAAQRRRYRGTVRTVLRCCGRSSTTWLRLESIKPNPSHWASVSLIRPGYHYPARIFFFFLFPFSWALYAFLLIFGFRLNDLLLGALGCDSGTASVKFPSGRAGGARIWGTGAE